MSKITFLMKVYNGAAFVGKSIESVLNQTERDIALYIRNNGSTDNSSEICKEYARQDSRIIYLENKIGGFTDEGYLYCDRGFWPEFNSEYVSIVDHDDLLAPDFASIMYNTAKRTGAQMTICGNTFFHYNTGEVMEERLPPSAVIDTPEKLSMHFEQLYGSLRTMWGKLYEASWYDKHYYILGDEPVGIGMSTDTYYTLSYLKHCRCLAAIDLPLYQYCVRKGSGFHSQIVKKNRISDGDILFHTAKNCLTHFNIATENNIKFLFAVHWGHMCDIMNVLCDAVQMKADEKIAYIQEILNNKLLQEYRDDFLDIIWDSLIKYLDRIIMCAKECDIDLWDYYLVKLYYIYKSKESRDKEPLSYTMLLSALCDPLNEFAFGIDIAGWGCWDALSLGEKKFKSLPRRVQRYFVKNLPRLKMLLADGEPDRYVDLEDSLADAVEKEDYERAGSLLSQLNAAYPLDEYAFYYRIYLSDYIGEHIFARKQAYAARVLWGDSNEIMELCEVILSAPPSKEEKEWFPITFSPDYLNIDLFTYEGFENFSNMILRFSLPSLLLYASAQRIKRERQGQEGMVYSISKETAKMVTQAVSILCFKTPFEGGATLYDSISDIKKHIREYQHLYSILNDQASKNTLTNLLLYRFTGFNEYLKRCASSERQYYLPELLTPRDQAVFVDCGAYDGGTVKEYIEVYGNSYKRIYAYEPAPENFQRVCDALKGISGITVYNKGVADQEDKLHFTSSLPDAANRIHPAGEVEVQITYLDKDIEEKIDFIKMDIEGMEQSALRGAKKHIVKDHPNLAICVYHLVEDLWKIPKMIEEFNPNQTFYLRYHMAGEIPEEIVFYACPTIDE